MKMPVGSNMRDPWRERSAIADHAREIGASVGPDAYSWIGS